MQVINQARTDFEYRLSTKEPLIKETIFSNRVITNIICEKLDSKKCTNKLFATLFDGLTYTISITNIGNIIVHNVYLKDLIPCSLKFVKNSLIVNGVSMLGKNPKEPISMGDILQGETKTIQFKTIIINIEKNRCIKNYGIIYFDYIYDITETPIKIQQNTNTVITIVENKLFKQINLESIIEIPYYGRDVLNIIKLGAKTKIVNYKISNIVINRIYDYKSGELCKIIIVGSIEYEIMYRYRNIFEIDKHINKLNYSRLKYIEGFSTSIVVPDGIKYVDCIDIGIYIENIETVIINKCIYVNTDLVLKIK